MSYANEVPCQRCMQSGSLGNYGTGFLQCPSCKGKGWVLLPSKDECSCTRVV
jgi:DnaJ-class molecular chaperone